MKRTELKRKTPLLTRTGLVRRQSLQAKASGKREGFGKPRAISPASPAQRRKIQGQMCACCESTFCHPAHLIPRGMTSVDQDDPRAVIPLCPTHHYLFDEKGLDIAKYLEPRFRVEMAFAVERVGLFVALRRITNHRWVIEESEAA